jgi:hypothetical protein
MTTDQVPPLFFENNAGQLLEDPAGFLRINWSRRARTLREFQDFCEHMLLGLQRNRWARALGNQHDMAPFGAAEQQWMTQHWLPRMVREGGYRYGALLVSPDVMVRLATAYVTTNVHGLPLTYRSFEHEAEALRWLLEQPARP